MSEVLYHRFRYLLSPQLDLYQNIARVSVAENVAAALDVGCGTGIGTVQLCAPGRQVLGVDTDPAMVEFARGLFGSVADFADGSAGGSFFKGGLVVCVETIEHDPDPARLVRDLKRAVTPGGTLYISTLNHNSQYRKNHAHVSKYTVASFRRLLEPILDEVVITDYLLNEELGDTSDLTPMVAIWRNV